MTFIDEEKSAMRTNAKFLFSISESFLAIKTLENERIHRDALAENRCLADIHVFMSSAPKPF